MAEPKRYYWLKLKDDFFTSKEIKQLRKLAGGDTFTIIYLKMLLRSISEDGKLYFEGIEDNFAAEVALDIDEEVENVKLTIAFLMAKGILVQCNEAEWEVLTAKELTGSECDSARRVRKLRMRNKAIKGENRLALQSNGGVTEGNTEIEKELEKEILTLVSQGKKDLIYSALENISDTEFANSNIDAITGESTDNYLNSQNAVLISLFKKGVESIDSFLNNNGLKMDYDDLGDVEISKGLRVAYLKDSIGNNGVHKSLFNEYIDRIDEIASLKAVKDNINSSITDQKDEESNKDKIKQMSELDKVIKTKIDELHNLIDGKDDSYIGRLMLETNPNLMNGLIPTTKEALSKNLYHQDYDSLPTYLQEKIDKMHKDRIDSGETELNYMQA